MIRHVVAALATAFLLLSVSAGSVSAHANLTHATIKNNQVFHKGHTPRRVVGTFAEQLDPKKSWMQVFEGEADHGLVTEKQHATVNFKNPKQMILPLPSLGKGKYYLIWHTHSAVDNHFAAGILYFSVR